MSDNNLSSVQVVLRIRPLVPREIENKQQCIVEAIPGQPQVLVRDNPEKAFTFNHVFDESHSQEFLFTAAIQSSIRHLFKGYNLTILAYGQTGSGKTHTMGTSFNGNGADMGVIQRAVKNIYDHIDEDDKNEYKISVSYMELYQEILYDLLADKERDQCVVEIREDSRGGIHVPGLTEIPVLSSAETYKCLEMGGLKRSTGATAMNATSSRSHAIFTITVRKISKEDPKDSFAAKFNLVDLAGSERPKKTKATGERFKEGVKINQGLLALSNVISALGEDNHSYISYRDSKLTRLLQDSLGGNSITLMIACISPAASNLDETLSTLRYADRAKKIKNKPIVNQDPSNAEVFKLKQRIKELELKNLETGAGGIEFERLKEENEMLRTKNQQLLFHLQQALDENANTIERTLITETARDKLEELVVDLQKDWKAITDKLPEVNTEDFDRFTLKIQSLQDEQDNVQNEVINYDVMSGSNQAEVASLSEQSDEIRQDIAKTTETIALKRIALQKQIQNLAREVALKEFAVKEQLASNMAHETHRLLQEDLKSKAENEAKIAALEKERDELLAQLKQMQSSNNSKQLTETRRNRLHELEAQIADYQKKCKEQEKMIKMRERDVLKIKQLDQEILSMKQMKVKLVKEMKAEADKFRQWKVTRERDICKLRDEGRKQQNKIVKMENMHAKQQNVLKRKVLEFAAVNKRLKDSLALSKKVSMERRGAQNGKVEKIQNWIEQELEIMLSSVEAEHHLELLKEEKNLLIAQKKDLLSLSQDEESSEEVKMKVSELDEQIETQSSHIVEMQLKIAESAQEVRSKIRWETVQTMVEAKHALKILFDELYQNRKEVYLLKANHAEELHKTTTEAKEKIENLAEVHAKEIEALNTQITSLTEQCRRIFEQAAENSPRLSHIRKVTEPLRNSLEPQKVRRLTMFQVDDPLLTVKTPVRNNTKLGFLSPAPPLLLEENETDLSADIGEDDEEKDPDWVATPIINRIARKSRRTYFVNSSNGLTHHSLSNGLNSLIASNTDETLDMHKRSSDGSIKCKCTTSCSSKRCSCKKAGNVCSATCKCSSEVCVNRENSKSTHLEDDSEKENSNSYNTTFTVPEEEYKHPTKKQKISDCTTPESD